MATIPEAFAIAVQHHQGGRLQAAEQIYRQILAVSPNQPDALHLLGVIASQLGRHEAAVEYITRAIQLQGGAAFFHNNLGEAYRALGRNSEAAACYHRALELKPDFAGAHSNLGNALKDEGKLEEAIARYRRALELKPDFAEAHNNLGAALKEQGNLEDAVACYRRALELKPDFAEAHNNLGDAFKCQGKPDEAVACYRRALELKPEFAAAHNNLGNALREQGKPDEAVACCRRAVELKPDFAEAHSNQGVALKDQGQFDQAVVCWRRAVELKPEYADAHSNLGNVLREQGKLDEASACYRRALELAPDHAGAHSNLGNVLKDQGKLDEAVACYRRALELKPDFAQAHSNLLCALHYRPGVTLAELAAAHADYDRRHAAHLYAGLCGLTHRNSSSSQAGKPDLRRLRLGFVSPDLGRHPVGFFLARVLKNLNREQLETICYSDRIVKDELTHQLHAAASEWRDVFGLSDQQLAQQIRADRIDILFDLAGHTAHNRLLVFARKPAPIQITWIGYEGMTGLAAMDYLLADRYLVAEGSEPYYRERVLRMPDGFMCYDPPAAAPPVAPPPALSRGYATFGSFNNPAKITAEVVAVWAKILQRLPAARLVLKYSGLGDDSMQRRYFDLFAVHGIGPQRLNLLPSSSYAEYLAHYHQVDVVLDPFPFSGSATTCEALWMGVPVITCPGETFASRHSLSHLSNVGLTETIAGDMDNYVELAVSLAGDLPRLAVLRAGLRQRMAASPLCDGKRFADNLTKILCEVWEEAGIIYRPRSTR